MKTSHEEEQQSYIIIMIMALYYEAMEINE